MPNGDMATTGVMIALLVVAFYFMILRPQRKRVSEQQKTVSELRPGSAVMLAGGLIGTVHTVGDKHLQIELAPGMTVTVVKEAVLQSLSDEERAALPAESHVGKAQPAAMSFDEALDAAERGGIPTEQNEGEGADGGATPQERKPDDPSAQN